MSKISLLCLSCRLSIGQLTFVLLGNSSILVYLFILILPGPPLLSLVLRSWDPFIFASSIFFSSCCVFSFLAMLTNIDSCSLWISPCAKRCEYVGVFFHEELIIMQMQYPKDYLSIIYLCVYLTIHPLIHYLSIYYLSFIYPSICHLSISCIIYLDTST